MKHVFKKHDEFQQRERTSPVGTGLHEHTKGLHATRKIKRSHVSGISDQVRKNLATFGKRFEVVLAEFCVQRYAVFVGAICAPAVLVFIQVVLEELSCNKFYVIIN